MHHNFSIEKRILTVPHSYCKHGVDPCYACACSTTSIIVNTKLTIITPPPPPPPPVAIYFPSCILIKIVYHILNYFHARACFVLYGASCRGLFLLHWGVWLHLQAVAQFGRVFRAFLHRYLSRIFK